MFSGYVALTVALVLAARRSGRAERAPGPFELALLALATMNLSRLIAKDSMAAFVRAPFIRFEGPAGEGEVNEVVIGTGLSHAFGELITCPFCLAQWVATGFVAGARWRRGRRPRSCSICAAARLSDVAQMANERLRPVPPPAT